MSRYRRVDVRIWNDRKFCALSRPAPNAQTLFKYFLYGRETTSIPGLFEAREVALADRLGWSVEDFRAKFREITAQKMARADWSAGLVWVPNAIKYNRPESPNVIRSWRPVWDELPECDLKAEAYHILKAFIGGMSEGFQIAFADTCGEAIGKAIREPCRETIANQEQEQEQEQDKKRARDPDIPNEVKPEKPETETRAQVVEDQVEDEPEPEIDFPTEVDGLIVQKRFADRYLEATGALWQSGGLHYSNFILLDRFCIDQSKLDRLEPENVADAMLDNFFRDEFAKKTSFTPSLMAKNPGKFYKPPDAELEPENEKANLELELSRERDRLKFLDSHGAGASELEKSRGRISRLSAMLSEM